MQSFFNRIVPMSKEIDYRDLNKEYKGKRIRLIEMRDDPDPIHVGTEGTILFVDDAGSIHVKWDNGRSLGVIIFNDGLN